MKAEVEAKDELWWQVKQRLEQEKLELIQVHKWKVPTAVGSLQATVSEAPFWPQ